MQARPQDVDLSPRDPSPRVDPSERTAAFQQLATRFVELVRCLPQTRQVAIDSASTELRLWTIIEAEPFDRAQREPIYAAELEALETHPGLDVDFRLINLREREAARALDILPDRAEVVWRR